MINNYDSVVACGSAGATSSCKQEETSYTAVKRTWLSFVAVLVTLFSFVTMQGQTTLISPTSDGGFENGATLAANNWTAVNSSTDSWIAGSTPVVSAGTKCAFVSSTPSGAQTWTYSQVSAIQHLYYDVTIPAGQPLVTLVFKWKAMGEGGTTSDWDNLKVFWGAVSAVGTPVANTAVSSTYQVSGTGATSGMYKLSSSTYGTSTVGFVGVPGTTYRLIFSWKSDITDIANPPAAIDEISLTTSTPANFNVVQGGLWSSPATWAGGVVPGAGNDVTIPAGMIVTVDQVLNYRNITVNGTLQWNGTANAMTVSEDLTIGATGSLLAYTAASTPAGSTINIGRNFVNDGYANLALATLNFNGSGSTLSGAGDFQGVPYGIIRNLYFQNAGSNAITTANNLIVSTSLIHSAGSLNTNGKLTVDNTVQIYGQSFNNRLASIAVTNMGSAYPVAPVVFGLAVTQWSNITGGINTLYVSGNNVYRCTTAANIGPSAPTHTSGTAQNLLWVGTIGTLGTPFLGAQSHTSGTQYFYGNNLYTCIATGSASAAAPPVHTSGAVVSGSATFLYAGTVAKVSPNFDATTGTVRSLNIVQRGSGYTSTPAVAFSRGDATTLGSGAAATAVVFISITGNTSSSFTKGGGAATISGGLTINSDQGASVLAPTNEQASSGVGNIFATNGGVNYTVAPQVGFSLPTALNLVTNPGSGYTTAPTVTLTGGTIVFAGTAPTFTVTVNNGMVVSVYVSGGTTLYSTLPTLAFSTGTATLAFPANCLPAATAIIGGNGQISNFTMTNSGYGYVAEPSVGVGTTSATVTGGTFTTVASGFTARIGLYNLTTGFYLPATTAVVQGDDAAIPSNRKLNTLTLATNAKGMNITSNLTIFGSATTPLGFTSSDNGDGNVLNLGGNNLIFTWNGYGGRTSTFGTTFAYIKNGSMTLTGRGGSSTFNYPFSGTFTWYAGDSTPATTGGSSVTRVTVSDTAAPTTTVAGTGIATGTRAFRVQYADIATGVTPVTGLNPKVTLNYNSQDALTGTQDQLFVSESSALNGPWTVRSAATGTGALAATGSRTTATATPGPIAPTNNRFYAWSNSAPQITSVAPLTLCANSGTFTITGTNLSGVTAVSIGGTPVTAFTVVSNTSITGYAGNGTTGSVSLVKNGTTFTGTDVITVTPSPSAPNVTPANATVNLGATVSFTATGGSTFDWYTTATGGTSIFTGATYSAAVCSSTTLYVAANNGSCEGARTAVTINVNATVITPSIASFCGTGGATVLTVTPNDPSITYTWNSVGGSPTFSATTGQSVTVNMLTTSDIKVTATKGACSTDQYLSIGVYALPSATVTTTASGVCPGTSATIGSGLSAGNFVSLPITPNFSFPPSNATTLINAGVATVLPDLSYSYVDDFDDSGWSNIPVGFNFNFFGTNYNTLSVGTNGTVFFGTTPNVGDFIFTTLPSTTEPFNMIAVLAMDNDLRTATGGSVKYWTEGYAPNRKFIVSYINAKEFGDEKYSSAQAVFYETTGVIEVHVQSSTNIDRNKLVGVNNGNGTVGVLAYASGDTASATNPIANPFAYKFVPPANYTTTWTATDANGTTTIASGNNIFSQSVSPAITTTYSISYTNQTTGCTNAAGSAQVVMDVLSSTPPASVSTIATSNSICFGESVGLSLSYTGSTDGLVFQWQSSIDNGTTWQDVASATATSLTVTPTVPTRYRCKMISCGGTPGYSIVSSVVFTNAITGISAATRCGTGTATINALANAGAVVNWYAAATGGSSLGTGVTFTTPTIAATTTYYAAAVSTATGSLALGAGASTSSSSGESLLPGFWGGAKTQYIIRASELIAAGLSAGPITSLGFEPTDSGQTYQGFNLSLGHTTEAVAPDVTFIPNSGLSLVYTGTLANNGFTPVANTVNNLTFGTGTGTASSFVWDGTSNVVVSVSWSLIPGASTSTGTTMKVDDVGFNCTAVRQRDNISPTAMADETSVSFRDTSRPRFTFNGLVACPSPRVPVVVTVNPAPALTLNSSSAAICNGGATSAVTIATGASNYNTYAWTPSTGVSGNSTTGWTFNPTATTTYTLTASQSGGSLCATTATFTANVNALPSTMSITPANPAVCVNQIQSLSVNGGTLGVNGKIGSGIAVNTTSTPFRGFWGGSKTQALYTAAELSALGVTPGMNITSIGYKALSGTPLVLNDFTVQAGLVSDTTLGSDFIAGASNSVFGPVNYTPTTGNGNIDFPLSTPIVWDGVSSLLVETCFNNNNGGGSSANSISIESTTVPTGLNLYRTQDNSPDVCSNSNLPSSSTNRPNLRINALFNTRVVWSPITNLFTDAAATIPYLANTNASTVYVRPTSVAPLTFVATSTVVSTGCVTTASVSVADITSPIVVTRPVTVQLNAAGTATLTAAQVDNGSSDNCSIATMTVSPNTFTCANVGSNTVTLTVTDASGNQRTGTADVTVRDQVGPTVVTRPVTVQLNAAGTASITPAQINNGSTDACGIASVTVNPSTFTCANIGTNMVTLTVTDVNGNFSTGTAIVTVTVNFSTTGDNDLDGTPDNCDPDDDNDGILDVNDNCPTQANSNQADNDTDGIGDACDNDDDNDGILDGYDNCPFIYNPGQEDVDNDGMGDICDTVEINVSQAITPDGDGVNDTWFINNIQNYPNNSVKVYNRWGDLIFSRNNYQNDWNGSYANNGSNIPDASSYYYQIDLDGNGSIDHDGWIYITK
jgi:gliding motility-associated-like protein